MNEPYALSHTPKVGAYTDTLRTTLGRHDPLQIIPTTVVDLPDKDIYKSSRNYFPLSPKRPKSPPSPTRKSTSSVSSADEPELSPVVSLIQAQGRREYVVGVFMLLQDLAADGKPGPRKWLEVYGVLTGTQIAYWDAEYVVGAAHTNHQLQINKPSYLNLADASFQAVASLTSSGSPVPNVVILSTTVRNRFLLQFPTSAEFASWVTAMRLLAFEHASLQKAYSATLLSSRGARLSDIANLLAPRRYAHEEWLGIRFGAGSSWTRVFARVEPGKKARLLLYANDQNTKKKKDIMATIEGVSECYAVFPESLSAVDISTMMKLRGRVTLSKGVTTLDVPQGVSTAIYVMPYPHPAVPGYDTLIRFFLPLLDAFNLYGRPARLISAKEDPLGLLFALPVLPRAHYLNPTDVHVDALGVVQPEEWWHAQFQRVLQGKMGAPGGYDGCGSVKKTSGTAPGTPRSVPSPLMKTDVLTAPARLQPLLGSPLANSFLDADKKAPYPVVPEKDAIDSPLGRKHDGNPYERSPQSATADLYGKSRTGASSYATPPKGGNPAGNGASIPNDAGNPRRGANDGSSGVPYPNSPNLNGRPANGNPYDSANAKPPGGSSYGAPNGHPYGPANGNPQTSPTKPYPPSANTRPGYPTNPNAPYGASIQNPGPVGSANANSSNQKSAQVANAGPHQRSALRAPHDNHAKGNPYDSISGIPNPALPPKQGSTPYPLNSHQSVYLEEIYNKYRYETADSGPSDSDPESPHPLNFASPKVPQAKLVPYPELPERAGVRGPRSNPYQLTPTLKHSNSNPYMVHQNDQSKPERQGQDQQPGQNRPDRIAQDPRLMLSDQKTYRPDKPAEHRPAHDYRPQNQGQSQSIASPRQARQGPQSPSLYPNQQQGHPSPQLQQQRPQHPRSQQQNSPQMQQQGFQQWPQPQSQPQSQAYQQKAHPREQRPGGSPPKGNVNHSGGYPPNGNQSYNNGGYPPNGNGSHGGGYPPNGNRGQGGGYPPNGNGNYGGGYPPNGKPNSGSGGYPPNHINPYENPAINAIANPYANPPKQQGSGYPPR
ncbi:hypothetical protein BABINDRAFT_166600 [Babjeviella inositovora NRRL Y-12698]|uniref:PH domain-containing protein n=1 Tax=Babjeviella inositovora NRRL Y-12698 TaxID=984486 RepID=A0A1E3QTI5_9ASCO|nr:uncharacterized protein BABINDRAFT_166600 [Babjeviella inositovora NRRL Y-12698]ODQ80247.1 hypothetical protein BABINDRAFT_166600 [Babjeviella inositovora NRRL Y-12698]